MHSFKKWENLQEGKLTMASLKPGAVATPIWKGRSAQNYGIRGLPVYDGKVKVLGIGIVPFRTRAEKKHVIGKDYKDVQTKYKDIWKSDEIRYGHFWSAQGRMKAFFSAIAQSDKRLKDGFVCWLWEVIDGPDKGTIDYCFIDSDDRWAIAFSNKSAEFELVT